MTSNKVFTAINNNDTNVSKFEVNKTFNINKLTENLGIQVSKGVNYLINGRFLDPSSDTVNDDGVYQYTLYKFLEHLYYRNVDVNYKQTNWYQYFDEMNTNTLLQLTTHTECCYIGLPQRFYGEKVQHGSFSVVYTSSSGDILLQDDGDGNVYFGTELCGNIFYQKGNVVLYDKDILDNGFESIKFADLEFRSTITLYEHTINCNIRGGKYQSTTNPTCFDSVTGDPIEFDDVSIYNTENFKVYSTRIGIYDDDNNLVAVGSFPKPLKMVKDTDFVVKIKYDI